MGREPIFNLPPLIPILIASFVLVELVLGYWGPEAASNIYLTFGFIPADLADRFGSDVFRALEEASRLKPDSEDFAGLAEIAAYLRAHPSALPFSLFSYAFLHAGWPHLVINSIWLMAFGSVVLRRIGTIRFLVLFALSSIGAALFHFITHSGDVMPVIGASGAVSGIMAAAIRFVFQPGESLSGFSLDASGSYRAPALPLIKTFQDRRTLRFILLWLAINIVTGLAGVPLGLGEGSIAWEAHVGGFITGLIVFSWVDPPMQDDPSVLN
ncbi:MAG: rhomboid family intramembrane serine protease [Alphaproteobacteria bacterium]